MNDEKSEVGEIGALPFEDEAAELRNSPDSEPALAGKAAPARKLVAKAGGRGKRVTIFLHDCDRAIIRELVAYLAGGGKASQRKHCD